MPQPTFFARDRANFALKKSSIFYAITGNLLKHKFVIYKIGAYRGYCSAFACKLVGVLLGGA